MARPRINHHQLKMSGITDTIMALRSAEASVSKKAINKAVVKASAVVRKAVRMEAPVESGALRRAIGTIYKRFGGRSGPKYAVVGVRVRFQDKKSGKIPNFYAGQVEFGTATNMANSFIRVGTQSVRDEVPAIYAKAIVDELKKLTT